MGVLHLGQEAAVNLDDDLLEHVFAVVVAKLRRTEPMLLTWEDSASRFQQFLVPPGTAVRAEAETRRTQPLDRHWLESLMVAASSNTGLSLDMADLNRHTQTIPTPRLRAERSRPRTPATVH
jgi:hypothetical protein